jgi:hypothetical protein
MKTLLLLLISSFAFGQTYDFAIPYDATVTFVTRYCDEYDLDLSMCIVNCPDSLLDRQPCVTLKEVTLTRNVNYNTYHILQSNVTMTKGLDHSGINISYFYKEDVQVYEFTIEYQFHSPPKYFIKEL